MHCILLRYFHWNLTKKLLYLYVFHSNTLKDHLQRLKFFCKFILDTKWNDQSSIGILCHRDTYQHLSCLKKKHQNHLQVVSFLQSKLLSLSLKKTKQKKTENNLWWVGPLAKFPDNIKMLMYLIHTSRLYFRFLISTIVLKNCCSKVICLIEIL